MLLRIFVVADIHCSYVYAWRAIDRAMELDSDLVFIAGDIECSDIIDEFVDSGLKIYGVTGNLDDHYIYRYMQSRGILLDGEVKKEKDYLVAGIGGLSTANNIERVEKKLGELGGDKLIILSHYPPLGFNDKTFTGEHAGLPVLREFIEKHDPVLFIHGHIHEARGYSRLGRTTIVNPGPLMHGYYSIVYVGEKGVEVDLERL